MRFERETQGNDDQPIYVAGNRWYFFLPLPMVGLWILVGAAQLVASLLTPSGYHDAKPAEPVDLFHHALAVMDGVGVLGWVLLIPCYFVVLASKRASAWWLLGAFCCGPNLVLYVVLLCLPSQRRWMAIDDPLESLPFNAQNRPQPTALLLQGSFACVFCHSLLNHGVSECRECGLRYRYEDGKPVADKAPYRRER